MRLSPGTKPTSGPSVRAPADRLPLYGRDASVAVAVTVLRATVKDCVTVVAALYRASPAWFAAIVHVPAATIDTVVPLTVQTAVVEDEKATVRPDVAVADTVKSTSP